VLRREGAAVKIQPAIVELSLKEIREGAIAGIDRQLKCRMRGTFKAKRISEQPTIWDMDIEGACAEIAVAKLLQMKWTGDVDTFKGADVDNFIQVRHTIKDDEYAHLFIMADDNREHAYVFVRGVCPAYKVVGWIWGDAVVDFKLNEKTKTYWIKQEQLTPIQTLVKYCEYLTWSREEYMSRERKEYEDKAK
jgi:hypothetical protein